MLYLSVSLFLLLSLFRHYVYEFVYNSLFSSVYSLFSSVLLKVNFSKSQNSSHILLYFNPCD